MKHDAGRIIVQLNLIRTNTHLRENCAYLERAETNVYLITYVLSRTRKVQTILRGLLERGMRIRFVY